MMAVQGQELQDLPPYTALLWSQFEENPHLMYNLFTRTVRPGGRTYESDKVIDMSGMKLNHTLGEFKVDSIAELHRVTNDLLNMPILFRIKVEHERTDHYVVVKVRKKWKDEFAVLVNTRHPRIRELLSHKLTEAMQFMQEGKNFCLKLDFGPSVKQWYSGIVDAEVSFCDSRSNSDSGHMEMFVHNYSTPNECCVNPVCILCCFPFWLLCGGPCYCVHRTLKVQDEKQSFNDLPVVLMTGVTVTYQIAPQQPGPNQIPPPQPRGQPMQQYGQAPQGYQLPMQQQYHDEPPPAYPGN